MLTLICQAALLLPAADPSPAKPVAMALSTKGGVTRARGDDKRRLGAMDLLRPGDEVTTAADGEAMLVFFEDGNREKVKSKSTAKVGEKGCSPTSAIEKQEKSKLTDAHLASLRDLAISARAGVGVLRGELPSKPLIVSPMFGAVVLNDKPMLAWPPPEEKPDIYVVELLSSDGLRRLWRKETKETRLLFPEKEMPLRPGTKYTWRVIARTGEDKQEEVVKFSKFALATKEEVDELTELKGLTDSATPTDWLLAAATYESHGVYGEALVQYEKLAAKFPNEANFQIALSNYYARAGRKDEAEKARAKAKELSGTGK